MKINWMFNIAISLFIAAIANVWLHVDASSVFVGSMVGSIISDGLKTRKTE